MNYFVPPTESTPKVECHSSSGKFVLEGKSYAENANAFYDPWIRWLNDVYLSGPAAHTELDIRLEYYNTSSTFALIGVLRKLEELLERGHTVTVRWHYHELDTDVEETGMDIRLLSKLTVDLVAYKD